MKKIYIVLSLILILTFRYYYEHEDKMLDKALIYAKENRNELKNNTSVKIYRAKS